MWLFFTIATTILWGFAELFYKKGALPDEKFAHLKICVFVGLAMGLHAFMTLLSSDFGFNPINLIVYLPVSGCYILSMALSFFGMRFIEESISDPVENTSGAICALLCLIFLKQEIGSLTLIAIAIITVGILGIGFLENRSERKVILGKKMAFIAFLMPFCYALLDALGSFLDVIYLDTETSPLIGVTEESIELVANTAYELSFFFCAVVLFIFMKIKKIEIGVKKQGDKLLAAVLETAGQLTYVYAMGGNGTIAAPIISSVCVVSLLLSRVFLKEKLTVKQYVFILMVIIGILLISVTEG